MNWQADDFPSDPYGHLTNQLGHACVGVVAGLALAHAGVAFLAVPLIVAAVYGVVWELVWQRSRLWADSLNDTANVMGGAAVCVSLLAKDYWTAWGCVAARGLFLLFGVVRRL